MEESVWTTTIIISTSLQSHDTLRMLRAQQHRIRLSDGVERGTFIFPLAGVAFMLVEPQHLPENLEESGLIEQIKKFAQVHRNCFVLLYAPFNGKRETDTLSLIQQSFFGSNPRVLPVRNNTDILKGMLTIAKATSKPHVERIQDHMALARTHILERSPVWDVLKHFI
ncbi:protein SPO16 homolog isoform X1 [Nerophis lumbriciformis]|uniref:protein SPO16 homolog isoform X1 n=1 Tax=Nerophis lumbriciformis TaxID=546530 RepID=UPI002ADFB38C|nr:protein SPO16 homolog isoform X1 [Nerophis lumbriciformis]